VAINLGYVQDQKGSLIVSEVFGQTFQGEGPSLGRRCAFVRLGGCNLACSWCDTPYTWDWTGKNGKAYDPKSELRPLSPEDIIDRLYSLDGGMPPLVVFSGGEPMLQAGRLALLLRALGDAGIERHVETNGTVTPPDDFDPNLFDQYVVSLKLASSGNEIRDAIRDRAILWYRNTGRAVWKFVATDMTDLIEIAALEKRYELAPIWVMPEGRTTDVVIGNLRKLADPVSKARWNLTTRLHVLCWGDERGR
jgi:7-carboxy-7-deazaguanine synthase